MLIKFIKWLIGVPSLDLSTAGVGVACLDGVPCISFGTIVGEIDMSRDTQIDPQLILEVPDLQTLERLEWAVKHLRLMHWPESYPPRKT
jgi:hypothetical protein